MDGSFVRKCQTGVARSEDQRGDADDVSVRHESEANIAHRFDLVDCEFLPQSTYIHVDDVRTGIESYSPNAREKLLAGTDLRVRSRRLASNMNSRWESLMRVPSMTRS